VREKQEESGLEQIDVSRALGGNWGGFDKRVLETIVLQEEAMGHRKTSNMIIYTTP
jgi:hypothetical protein